LLTLGDANYNFAFVSIGKPGILSDEGILKSTYFVIPGTVM
jgi:hypothetical protein